MRTLEAPGPECGPVIGLPRELGVRRKLLARFPYAIVFVESDAFVRVISVMHGHRRPAYWRPPSLNRPSAPVTDRRAKLHV